MRRWAMLALLPLAWFGGAGVLPAHRAVLGGAAAVMVGGVLAFAWLRRRPRRPVTGA